MADRPLVAIYANAPHQNLWCGAFAEGVQRHGIEARQCHPSDFSVEPDVAVFWSHRRVNIIQRQRETGKDYIVLECPYFGPRGIDTMQMCSAGWNGLNGRADFRNADSPGDRWKRHGPGLEQWRAPGEYALIMGQVPGDMSHAHADISAWYGRMVAEWGEIMPVAFRDHPKAAPYRCDVPKLNGPLDEALSQAVVAVTFNSNSGVDALISGVPVYAEDEGSMVYGVSSHRVGQIVFPDRRQWSHDLAYCQWTLDEYRDGTAWEHLSGSQRKD